MKISTRGRYAVRVMLDLALHNTGENIKVRDIAKRQDISEKYLEQIISILSKAGYVHAIRGANGGYRLSDSPDKYTLGDILRLTEGSLVPVACLESDTNPCERSGFCETLSVWKDLADAINNVVDNVTIGDLVNKHNEAASINNYVI